MTIVIGKGDLAKLVAANTDLSQAEVKTIIDATFDQIVSSASAGDQVRIIGFGSFTVKDRAARLGRNPRTGETIEVAPTRALTFKASKSRAL